MKDSVFLLTVALHHLSYFQKEIYIQNVNLKIVGKKSKSLNQKEKFLYIFWKYNGQKCQHHFFMAQTSKWFVVFLFLFVRPVRRSAMPAVGCRWCCWSCSRWAAAFLRSPFRTLSQQSRCSWWNRNNSAGRKENTTGRKTGNRKFHSYLLGYSYSLK